jgi:glycosyltransferase involved in cell wall biosynthesis
VANKKLNICLISREFPPDTAFGGIATFSLDTAMMLKEHGHEVTVFSQSLSQTHTMDYHGIQVHKIRVPAPFDRYGNLPVFIATFNFLVYREVMRCHRQQPFDLIDVPDHLAEGWFVALFSGLPIVTRLHTPYALIVAMGLNNYKKNLSYKLIKAMEKSALKNSSVLYAPCSDLVRRCEDLFKLKRVPLRIFGYPLDTAFFSPVLSSSKDGITRIIFLGRLEQRKGIETIVEAFPMILATHPNVTLTLVGRDTPNLKGYSSARNYMKSEFDRVGCGDRVQFEDHVSLEQLPKFFHDHDIVWVPSLYDNYPIVCLEAMACGKAVVVSNAGGLPEMVKDGDTGLVFNTGDPTSLAQCTLSLLDNNELMVRLGENARLFAVNSCSSATIYSKTLDLYQTALGVVRRNK